MSDRSAIYSLPKGQFFKLVAVVKVSDFCLARCLFVAGFKSGSAQSIGCKRKLFDGNSCFTRHNTYVSLITSLDGYRTKI